MVTTKDITVGEYLANKQPLLEQYNITTCIVIDACGHCYFNGPVEELQNSLLTFAMVRRTEQSTSNPNALNIYTK